MPAESTFDVVSEFDRQELINALDQARRDVGTPVFGGMILASFIGIFAIPPLYVMFQGIRERLRPATRMQTPTATQTPAGNQKAAE